MHILRSFAIVATLVLTVNPSVGLAQCGSPPMSSEGAYAHITFRNTQPTAVEVWSLSPDGGLTRFAVLAPGDMVAADTNIGHAWQIMTATGRCMRWITIRTPGTVNL